MASINKNVVANGCQICGDAFAETAEPFVYDAKTYTGQWAFLCADCFSEYCNGLGLGKGQKYDISTLQKVEG